MQRHSQEPLPVLPLTHPRGLMKSTLTPFRPFTKSTTDWQHVIGSTWGPGIPFANKLAVFDAYAAALTNKFDGFLSLGQKVKELVNSDVDAGYHEIQFSATNYASGVYFYRMQAGSYVETKKLLLLH